MQHEKAAEGNSSESGTGINYDSFRTRLLHLWLEYNGAR